MNVDDIHFETIDFEGRRIICDELRWNDHIIGDPDHPYMEGTEQEIIEALQDPAYGLRYYDRTYPNHRVYYKISKTKDYYTKVVVRFDNDKGEGIGKVWTAYQPDSVTDSERPEFPHE